MRTTPPPSSLVTGFWSMYTKEVYVFTDTRVSLGEHTTPHLSSAGSTLTRRLWTKGRICKVPWPPNGGDAR